ncbi:MAG: hypothetical protein HPY83_11300 [Anaerolineae bacterium]|nr:hypothetical protein [Anaerolineae bacterium]
MPNVYVLFWFDVEDCMVPQSDDAAKRLAWILERHRVRGTMKLVGQKARVLEQRVRYDVIDALQKHDIGFHSNWHGLRPQVAEYLAPLNWEDGAAEFERRERPGLLDVRRIFGVNPVTYGQPGSNWAPQAFPVLRRWGIPTYVSGFGYVGVDCQPFYYGGVLCTSHMYGKRGSADERNHLLGLNFELGAPGELEKHKAAFTESLRQLSPSGGLISIYNHPCTLVMEEWFSTYLKPRELTEAGYAHFEEFLSWVLSHPNVRPTCASELPRLYPDLARGHYFAPEELRQVAEALASEVSFVRLGELTLSAAEAFRLLARALLAYCESGALPQQVLCLPVYNPTRPPEAEGQGSVPWDDFCRANREAVGWTDRKQEVPPEVQVGPVTVGPGAFLAALARAMARLLAGQGPPEEVLLEPVPLRFEWYVDEAAARSSWSSAMMRPGFSAPGLLELARLGAWSLKPAVLRAP